MTEDDIRDVLGGLLMAQCSTLPPPLCKAWAQGLRVAAQERADAGRTTPQRVLQALADLADQVAQLPRHPM